MEIRDADACARAPERGIALLVILWLGMLLTLLLYSLLLSSLVGTAGVENRVRAEQARQAALSAMEAAVADVSGSWFEPTPPGTWWNDPARYSALAVGETTVMLVNPLASTEADVGYGISDEAARLNLNVATKDMLMKLPGMTEELAESILAWRGSEEELPKAATDEYYMRLDPPYRLKKALLETTGELLLIRGASESLLWGQDTNGSGRRDASEPGTGEFSAGLLPYVTVLSYDANVDKAGQARLNLNTAERGAMIEKLGPLGISEGQVDDILAMRAIREAFASIGDILDVPSIRPPHLRAIADVVTIVDTPVVPGLVNVNTAPEPVLKALPGMDDEKVQKLIEFRSQPEATLDTIGWVMDALDAQTFRAMVNFITVRSLQFRVDATAVHNDAPIVARVWAVYDRMPGVEGFRWVEEITQRGVPARRSAP